jgi:maleamate amidohydrolase
VVDFQNGMTRPDYALGASMDGPVERCRELLDVARNADVPVIFIVVAYAEDHSDIGPHLMAKIPGVKEFIVGTHAVEVDDRLGRRPDERVIIKRFPSSFYGTGLAGALTEMGIDTLLITGCSTSGCVRATTYDAFMHGYRPSVIRECVGDRGELPAKVSLFDMDYKAADVVSLQEAIDYLTRKTLDAN